MRAVIRVLKDEGLFTWFDGRLSMGKNAQRIISLTSDHDESVILHLSADATQISLYPETIHNDLVTFELADPAVFRKIVGYLQARQKQRGYAR